MSAAANPLADQMMAVFAEVERGPYGDNANLGQDPLIEQLIVLTIGSTRVGIGHVLHEVQFGGPTIRPHTLISRDAWCPRCLQDRDATEGRSIDVPLGADVMRLHLCPACVEHIEANFSGIVWRE